ncbi:zinc ribbon domain-containing protein [Halopiger aswanensis]|uniref:Rubredoxin-like zinc ribbon protein n=1 Tax=Halopiger aswanensis TaxID=148449 RepID=A0A419WKH0_9EURY|nr:zinc ribbon domain-containing protein [Halopiger aswanensis]RKD95927.1 rubredoxin-like zinc ribbon protein [Halopiger aswanensis]
MGFFENLGRKVGEFTHEAKQAADEDAAYACTDCGERFYTAREECPACGSDAIVERQASSTAEDADTDSSSSSDSGSESTPDPSATDDPKDGESTE